MKIISCTNNRELSKEIAKKLNKKLVDTKIIRFADGEVYVEINENMRGQDVFIIQSTCTPVNDSIMELLICIDALRRASAKSITAVLPYFAYARQDRKVSPRSPISAKLFANLLMGSGASRVLTMDLHANQIQGFFDIPVDNLFAGPTFVQHIKKNIKSKNLVCVDKRRSGPGKSEVMNVIGNVKNKVCVIIDDLVDSGGTIVNAAAALKSKGAKDVYAYVVHGVLTGEAVKKINTSKIKKFIISNSIMNIKKIKKSAKFQTISVGTLFAEAIKRISISKSVSKLFK
jgi:ribose-phosphate pyrophosphokinase